MTHFFKSSFMNLKINFQGVYNVKNNPKYLNGECTEDELLAKFLQNFESSGIENAEVRKNKKSNILFNIKKSNKK